MRILLEGCQLPKKGEFFAGLTSRCLFHDGLWSMFVVGALGVCGADRSFQQCKRQMIVLVHANA